MASHSDASVTLATAASRLSSSGSDRRSAAAGRLLETSETAPERVATHVDALIDACRDTAPTVQDDCSMALFRAARACPTAVVTEIDRLAALLAVDNRRVRRRVAGAVAAAGRERPAALLPAAPALETALEDTDALARFHAAAALATLAAGRPAAVAPAVDTLRGRVHSDAEDGAVVDEALSALANIARQDPDAVTAIRPAVTAAFDSPREARRIVATSVLDGVVEGADGLPTTFEPALEAALRDDDERVREMALAVADRAADAGVAFRQRSATLADAVTAATARTAVDTRFDEWEGSQ